MEIITGVERRRRWRLEDKLRILAEAEQPGMSFSEVARRHDVSRGLLQTWRRRLQDGLLAGRSVSTFVPLRIADGGRAPVIPVTPSGSMRRRGSKPSGLMEIDLGGGRLVRVDRDVDVAALRRVIEALAPR